MRYCYYCMSFIPDSEENCPVCGCVEDCFCAADHLRPGSVLQNGKFLVGHAIGAGGFGITYIALDQVLNVRVAIKEYYPKGMAGRSTSDSSSVTVSFAQQSFFNSGKERFLREARILAELSDEPGIVNVRDYFEENNTAYIVMEYLQGQTLKDYLDAVGPIPFQQAFSLLLPVMKSLEKVHEKGMIHRDISPDNIMLMTKHEVKLLDFGASRDIISRESNTVTVMLKQGYTPEEQYSNNRAGQGKWTDVYALSATLYKCITGKVPIDAISRRSQELKWPSELGFEIDASFEAALMKGLAIHSEDRYQTIDSLIEGLQKQVNREGTIWLFDNTSHDSPSDLTDRPESEKRSISIQSNDSPEAGEAVTVLSASTSNENNSGMNEVEQKQQEEKSRFFKRITAVAASIVVLLFLFGLIVLFALPQKVEMPSLEGLTKDEAQQALEECKLNVSFQYEKSKSIHKDFVISQEFQVGTQLKKNDEVIVVLSSGKVFVLPDFTGTPLVEAVNVLKKNNIEYNADATEFSDTIKRGAIIGQTPKKGTEVSEGEEVVLVISKGIEMIPVPDFLGMTEGEVRQAMDEQLRYSVREEYSDVVPKGEVIKQEPAPGDSVEKNTMVTITYSLGEKPTTTAPETTSSAPSSVKSTTETTADPFSVGWTVRR